MPACPSCQQPNRDGARFCDSCGTPLAAAPARPEYAPPDALAAKIRAQARALEGERKQVTVLFADVSGSMDLAERVDAEAWRQIMDRFFTVLCEGVHRYEGTVVQFTGDGVMALFGAPVAHEDHAIRAAHAALRLLDDVAAHAAELRREESLNFSIRIGLNSGEVVVGGIGEDMRVDFTAIGHTVGLAKRMESLAEPGRAYLTARTAALVEGFFDLRDLGPFEVKGVSEPVGVFELAGIGSARSRFERARRRGFSRFVGRERELDVLDAALERTLAGEGCVVGVVGEPGVGKSRLCHEFAERCRARGVPVFAVSGQAHARAVPYHVALEMLRAYFGIEDGMPAQAARERVAGRLLLISEQFAENLPIVFDFLGIPDPQRPPPRMDPDARQRLLLAGARQLVRGHAAREAAVNLIEDLHWIDDGSRTFLEALVEAVPGHRSLVVVNFRPEFRAEWMQSAHYHELRLVPLGAEAVGELLDDLLGADASLDGLPEEIRRRTGGNPFFVEELVQALVDDGTLEGARGARRLARPLREIAVPPSVHDVLAARLDRLPEREKAVAQAASVLGKELPADVLGRVAGLDRRALADALEELVEAGFLLERDGGEYAFRHPLTQEVAYGSLLAERRRGLHGAAAGALVELEADRADERAALVATHWEAAGDRLQAARWHTRAAVWAGTSDAGHAAEHWRAVRTLCADLPVTPETDGLALGACLWTLQFAWRLGIDEEEIEAIFADGHVLAERTGDPATIALLQTVYAGIVGLSRDMQVGVRMTEQALAMVSGLGRADVEVPILIFATYALFISGRYAESFAECERRAGRRASRGRSR